LHAARRALHRTFVRYVQSRAVELPVAAARLSTVDAHGTRRVLAGVHTLTASRGHGDEVSARLAVSFRTVGRPDAAGAGAAPASALVISTLLHPAP
jgi:hypothetical protein